MAWAKIWYNLPKPKLFGTLSTVFLKTDITVIGFSAWYSLVPIRSLTAPSLSVVINDVAGATSSEPEIQKQINLRNVTYVEEESDCCLTPNE